MTNHPKHPEDTSPREDDHHPAAGRWHGHHPIVVQVVFALVATLFTSTMVTRPALATTAVGEPVRRIVALGQPIWVYLQDRENKDIDASSPLEDRLSERAIRRLQLRGANYDPRTDQPVSTECLRSLRQAGLTIRTVSRWFNAVSGLVPPDRLDALAALDCVRSVQPVAVFIRSPLPVEPGAPALPKVSGYSETSGLDYGLALEQIQVIEADQLHAVGLQGEGVLLGFLDTGFDLSIGMFESLDIVATRDFINGDTDVGDDDPAQMSHGTATLSVCGGFAPGQLIGVAAEASYALAKTEVVRSETRIEEDYWVAGLEWADSLGCDIVSSSLGYTDWYTYSDLNGNTAVATRAADLAAKRGLLVVNSAGNEGANPNWRYVVVPADGDSVLAVGATDFEGRRARFSSYGPTADGRIKPDIAAPGLNIWSANPQSDAVSPKNGTSFSAPLVSGVCALLLQQEPELTPFELIQRLRMTASQADTPDTALGWGSVRAAAAAGTSERYQVGKVEVWPNPITSSALIVSPDSIGTGASWFEVYTVAGDMVYRGEIQYRVGLWPGTNASGALVASGVYLIRVQTPLREEIVKVAVKRRN